MLVEAIEYVSYREYGILGMPTLDEIKDSVRLAIERNCVIKIAWKSDTSARDTKKIFITKDSNPDDIFNSLQ